jgi:anti-anti-sigma factor
VIVVRAIGEIDLLTAPAWRRTLDAAVRIATSPAAVGRAVRPAPRLVCDLSATTFLGATGIGVLVDLAERTAASGVELRVVVSSRPVRRLLGLTGLDQTVAIESGLEHAVMPAPSSGAA